MIIRAKGGRDVELFSFALTNMVRWGYQGGLRNVQPRAGEREMRGIPAIHRAARLRAEAVASLDLFVWRGSGFARERIDNTWQARLFRNPPNDVQTRFGFWETVEESLAYRGNAYIWKNVDGGRIVEWWALHPDQVDPKTDGSYKVTVADGYVDPTGKGAGKYTVGPETILHIRGHGQGGTLIAPSPIEVFREAMAGPIGRQRHEARMWRRGTALQVAIEFPANVSKEAADQWRESWRSNYEGTEGETTAVIGGGGQIKPIGMTATDAQFVEMENLTVFQAEEIMGVPAPFIRTGVTKATPDLEQELMKWLRFGLGTELARIENALACDETLFGRAALLATEARGSLGLQPGFFTEGFVRGDLETEDTIAHQQIQDGRLLVDEWRERHGLEPLPDGLGKIPQIVPVGGAPNPNPQPAPTQDDAATARAIGVLQGTVDVLSRLATTPDAPSTDPELLAILAALSTATTVMSTALASIADHDAKADPDLLAALQALADRDQPQQIDLAPVADALARFATALSSHERGTDPALLEALSVLAANRRKTIDFGDGRVVTVTED